MNRKDKAKLRVVIFLLALVVTSTLALVSVRLVYNSGVKYFVNGDFESAEKEFNTVSFYPRAKTYLTFIDMLREYNIIDDELLTLLAEEGTDRKVQQKFTTYVTAIGQFNSGDYDKALQSFTEIEGFQRADQYLMILHAVNMTRNNDLKGAKSILNAQSFPEGSYLLEIQQRYLNYIAGLEKYEAKEYYEAYLLFEKAGDIEDTDTRKEACAQPTPNKVIYFDRSYISHDVTIKIFADELQDRMVKVFDGNNKAVAIYYLKKGESVTMDIDQGIYRFSFGCGDHYFGSEDLFGLETGKYYRLILGGVTDYNFEKSFVYSIKLSETTSPAIVFETITFEEFAK